jgi:hypothetical protein
MRQLFVPTLLLLNIGVILCNDLEPKYDLFLTGNKSVSVSTIARSFSTPVGITVGLFRNTPGLFVTSYKNNTINFIPTTNGCEQLGRCIPIVVAGTGADGTSDGAFTSASFSDPSRLLFSSDLGVLFVTDRVNGIIRYLNFASSTVGTVNKLDGTPIKLNSNTLSDSSPELDILQFDGTIYLSDTRFVYNLTANGGLDKLLDDGGILKRFENLRTWQIANNYDLGFARIFITSITVNTKQRVLYVAYSFARSALVSVPLPGSSSTDIKLVIGDSFLYNVPQQYPRPRDGSITGIPVILFGYMTFPMDMHYDASDDVLYWTEVWSHLSGGTRQGALGSVGVRRLFLSTGMVDYYAGNIGSFRNVLGRSTGFVDGTCDVAVFSYPLGLAFYGNKGTDGSGPLMYIADYTNNAIRKVSTVVNTPAPTAAPTTSRAPTRAPSFSQSPTPFPTAYPSESPTLLPSGVPSTGHPSALPTGVPTGIPTTLPSISFKPTPNQSPTAVPTSLNGDCLE